MENSIEAVWTKGFMKEESMAVPKINNLYQKKSRLLIDQLKRTYRIDNRSILPLSVIAIIVFSWFGHVILGVYVMTLMLGMYFLNKKQLGKLERISVEHSTYDYLLTYHDMFQKMKLFYTGLLGFGLPVFGIIGYALFFWDSAFFRNFLKLDLSYILGILIGISLLLSLIGVLSYRLSLRLIYGKHIKKLEEMISDMHELRK